MTIIMTTITITITFTITITITFTITGLLLLTYYLKVKNSTTKKRFIKILNVKIMTENTPMKPPRPNTTNNSIGSSLRTPARQSSNPGK